MPALLIIFLIIILVVALIGAVVSMLPTLLVVGGIGWLIWRVLNKQPAAKKKHPEAYHWQQPESTNQSARKEAQNVQEDHSTPHHDDDWSDF